MSKLIRGVAHAMWVGPLFFLFTLIANLLHTSASDGCHKGWWPCYWSSTIPAIFAAFGSAALVFAWVWAAMTLHKKAPEWERKWKARVRPAGPVGVCMLYETPPDPFLVQAQREVEAIVPEERQ